MDAMKNVRQQIGGLGNLMFKQAYLIGQTLDGKIPDVYVQGEKYWKNHADYIKEYFNEGIGEIDAVAIHVRRGDYIKAHNFHVDLWPTGYYQKAIDLFPEERRVIVFCKDNQGWDQDKEDRQWCRDNLEPLLGERMEMPDRYNNEVQDLNIMASCKNIIGANSSFSWWAAYIGNHDRVVMPKRWFVDGIQRTELLDSWTLL